VALKSQGKGDDETIYGLPPNAPRKAFLVDEYPACPDSWMRSSGRIKSFFVPVLPDRGLWLDFNATLQRVAQHVAIVVSTQGVNAVTGLPCADPQLEQYIDKCPKHKEDFGPDRLCKKCGHKWPKQNYLNSTGTPSGLLWLDGFRADDGTIRQYVFTESAMRSVARAIIGKDRVFALGISYFLSKTERPVTQPVRRFSKLSKSFSSSAIMATASTGRLSASSHLSTNMAKVTIVKQLEIAAGAKIRQQIFDDPNGLDFWQVEPTAMIVVNYCTESDAERIISAGRVDLSGNREGFLRQVPVVGNP
jgi:hypothetical protein